MHEKPSLERTIQDRRQIATELGSALRALNSGMELMEGSRPEEYTADALKLRISDTLSKISTGDRAELKAVLRQETTETGVINRVSFNQQNAAGTSDHVTITTFTDRGSRVPVYLEAEIAPIGIADPNKIRRYQLARRDKL